MNPSADSPAPKRTDILAPGAMTDDRIRRRVFASGLLALVVASWSYLVYQDWAMRHMDLVDMAMPGAGPWSSADFLLVFVMWAVMMIAMMLPSVLPTLRAYREVVSTRDNQRRPDALAAVLAAGFHLVIACNARRQPIRRVCAAHRGGRLSVDAVKARLPCPMCSAAAISPPPLAPRGVGRVAHGHRSRRILCRLLLDVDGTLVRLRHDESGVDHCHRHLRA
jgi:hypothetical protein